MAIENKPQGCTGYGSIGHLPGTKLKKITQLSIIRITLI